MSDSRESVIRADGKPLAANKPSYRQDIEGIKRAIEGIKRAIEGIKRVKAQRSRREEVRSRQQTRSN